MKKKIIVFILCMVVVTEIICITGLCICKGQDDNTTEIKIRMVPQQTVLYTIYRGNYYNIGEAIKELCALANVKGMSPCGYVSTCYLNSPVTENERNRLIEIQIPVDAQAMELAGTLGDMTDVKVIPAMKVAVAIKPEGYYDPSIIIEDLFSWVNKKGYVVMGKMRQAVLNGGNGGYRNLRTEFLLPIGELSHKNQLTLMMDPCYI
ncbi:MAG: GyrI-like domain-containing protein [Sedimentisphaerales bacterium]|nr:GyrI-like domain-containing protein [Sedimentisphaerales bacterium]